MAYQNAFLRKSRAVLLVLMIGVSMGIMLGLEGLYDGMSQRMIDKTKRSDCGDVSLFASKYLAEHDIAYHMTDTDKKVATLKQFKDVKQALWRIESNGLAQTARKSKPAKLIGINLVAEEAFGHFSQFVQKGKLDFGKDGVFAGNTLAEKLKLHLGSKIIFSMQDSQHQLQSVTLRVKAIIKTTNISMDERGLFIPREKLNKLLNLMPHTATQIAVMGKNTTAKHLAQHIKKHFKKLDVKTFIALYPQLKQMQDLLDVFNEISFFIVMTVVFIGILGVMYVSILDRVREFGILLGIGYAYRYIRTQILIEAVFLGFTGYLLGSILGLLFLMYLKKYGLDLSIFSEGMEKFGLDSVVYATIKTSYFVNTFAAIALASSLSVILPLRKIKTLNPIDVIRNIG
jgi:ABC-type lipoprotein release transport system permease subunit